MDKDIYICLQNGEVFKGKQFGADSEPLGELVFTTGMGGYIETLTDPSYYGQIVMQTFPLMGNYGIIGADMESDKSVVRAYVVREKCDAPSNFRCEKDLDTFLKENGIVGVYGVDTREITKMIRETGVMNALITTRPENADLEKIAAYRVEDAVAQVTCQRAKLCPSDAHQYNVVLMDFGAKQNIVRELQARGCNVAVMPADTKAEDILKLGVDGVMLSNGPGDPADNTEIIAEIAKLVGNVPIFGICLGHQLLALAMGGKTEKLKYGHRGVNQPVKNLKTSRTYISSQNHGYAVISESVEENGGVVTYVNANDNTCEGVEYPGKNAFSVQFHPEACSGPHDTRFLFDTFIDMMGGTSDAAE